MHRGCFVVTPTPLISARSTSGSRTCVCVRAFLGWAGQAGHWARSGAPHLFLWPLCPSSLFGPLRAWVALFAGVAVFFFFFLSLVPPLSLAFRVSRPGVPWALASCCPPPTLSFAPPVFSFFSPSCFSFVFCLWRFCVFFSDTLFVFFFWCAVVRCGVGLCVRGCGVCCCVLLSALRSVVCCVFCLVLCGVLVLGWVLAPCCPAGCCG